MSAITVNHLITGFIFGFCVSIVVWLIGMIFNAFLLKTKYYSRLSNLNFITSKRINKALGLQYFRWTVKNTFFKFFNQKIKVESQQTDLNLIRHEMTQAEISHLIGFVLVSLYAVYQTFMIGPLFGFIMMIPNLILNLYPSLLQQENKRRIDLILKRHRYCSKNHSQG